MQLAKSKKTFFPNVGTNLESLHYITSRVFSLTLSSNSKKENKNFRIHGPFRREMKTINQQLQVQAANFSRNYIFNYLSGSLIDFGVILKKKLFSALSFLHARFL